MHLFNRIQLAYKNDSRQAGAITSVIAVAGYVLVTWLFVMSRTSLFAADLVRYGAPVAGMLLGALGFSYGFSVLGEKRLIENIPTSRIRSLAMGLVEVAGQARPKALLKSPVTGTGCAFYRYKIEKYVRSGRSSHWEVVDQGCSTNYFYVDDGTGKILVDPVEAELHLAKDYEYTGSDLSLGVSSIFGLGGNKKRYTEWYILPGDTVYAMGTVKKWKSSFEDRKFRLAEKLRLLKEDKQRLQQFDADHDGSISLEEWERAKEQAEQDLLKEDLDKPADDDDSLVVTRVQPDDVMIISDSSEKDLVRSKNLTAALWLVAGAGVILYMAYLLAKL